MPTRIMLDDTTFAFADRYQVEDISAKVAALIDSLIPGESPDHPGESIDCYNYLDGALAPAALYGELHAGEWTHCTQQRLRITLCLLPGFSADQMTFQLSHELAHIKMGLRSDNLLIETFATYISKRALMMLGHADYYLQQCFSEFEELPDEIRQFAHARQADSMRTYWQTRANTNMLGIEERPTQMVGTELLSMDHSFDTASLLGVANLNLSNQYFRGRTYSDGPDIVRIQASGLSLTALGY